MKNTPRRGEKLTDSDVLEASIPHLQDVVRFEDRYGRAPGEK